MNRTASTLLAATVLSAPLSLASPAEAAVDRQKATGVKALAVAAAQEGDPYRSGSAGPEAFDCSGLTSYAYARAGKSIPRSSEDQRRKLPAVPNSARRPGDIIVFVGSGGRAYHVGIYAGNGMMWDSPKPGKRVTKRAIWTSRYVVRRP